VAGPRATSDPVAYLVAERRSGRVTMQPLPLGSTGDGDVTVGFSNRRVRSLTITLANASTRFDCWFETAYSCQGRPRDDNREFDLRVRAFRA
jgi:hypothetical protein